MHSSFYIPRQQPRAMISNIDAGQAGLALQAAQETGFDITVGPANDINGWPVVGDVGLYSTEQRDHEPFWARFHELQAAQEAQ